MSSTRKKRISFQGAPGAYSHLACQNYAPACEPVPCEDFAAAFDAVTGGDCDLAMIPIDNSTVGRVADIHHLLPKSGLQIIGEWFQPVKHQLLGLPGADFAGITDAWCHVHTVGQVRQFTARHGIRTHVHSDNAAAAKMISEQTDRSKAAIASGFAGEVWGLESLAGDINDGDGNTTRFVVLSKPCGLPENDGRPMVTSVVFRTRSVPAALYKALTGFATGGVNITKLESYITDHSFQVAQFYIDVEGHQDEKHVATALDDLRHYSVEVNVLGSYPAADFRAA